MMFYLVKDCNTVEKQGFKKLVATFDSRYELPSRTYFSRTALPELYSNMTDKV